MPVLDVFDGSVNLSLEVAVVVLAEHRLVRCEAGAFNYFAANRTFKR